MNDNGDSIDFIEQALPNAILKSKAYCDKHNIKFLLLSMPDATAWSYAKYKKMTEWSEENNIDYLDINMLLSNVGLNFDTDSKDYGMHLNIHGATKMSKFLARYLKNIITWKIIEMIIIMIIGITI